eukprot:scaffold180882_cov22-Tisochrysis_lutea.AAC.3
MLASSVKQSMVLFQLFYMPLGQGIPGSVKARNTSDTGNWEGQLQQGAGGHKRRPSMSDGLLGGVNANPRRSVNSGAAGMHNSDAWMMHVCVRTCLLVEGESMGT